MTESLQDIERLVADMVRRHNVAPVKPEERTELIEVVRRRIKNLAEEYSEDFLRALRRMLADYCAITHVVQERDDAREALRRIMRAVKTEPCTNMTRADMREIAGAALAQRPAQTEGEQG